MCSLVNSSMTEKECREQPKPDWWNAENWKYPDGTEITAMEMEAWTHPKNPECDRYYTDLLIKAQNDGEEFWCRKVQVKALVATIDWFSGLTSSSSAARGKPENQTGCLSPSDGASCWLFFGVLLRWGFVQSFRRNQARNPCRRLHKDSAKTQHPA
jgi:hypothetical protein